MIRLSLLCLCLIGCASTKSYPSHWWAEVPKEEAKSWEILPSDAQAGEVILSKRNELGLLSNFAATPFRFEGKTYASLEGFWQMMKFPEGAKDERRNSKVQWKLTREQVSQMTGFEAKRAGDHAKENMKRLGIHWITYKGRKMDYRGRDQEEHFRLIERATWAKVRQNSKVRKVLLSTGDLKLRPDHHQRANAPKAWRYYDIYMSIREKLRSTQLIQ